MTRLIVHASNQGETHQTHIKCQSKGWIEIRHITYNINSNKENEKDKNYLEIDIVKEKMRHSSN
ncbi:MAG TPA: hypothetical protein VN703_08480 [Candidatus Sulfopaludibacter sp.]|nr:hypothetical protein [Candidatus Sulfopaludibacter sp.]